MSISTRHTFTCVVWPVSNQDSGDTYSAALAGTVVVTGAIASARAGAVIRSAVATHGVRKAL